MDIHDIPFPENTFDILFCNHVLEHVQDDKKAMSEMLRVLKPGGWAILQIPIFKPLIAKTIEDPTLEDPKKRTELFGQDDHVRMYGKDYADRIRSTGFKVIGGARRSQGEPGGARRSQGEPGGGRRGQGGVGGGKRGEDGGGGSSKRKEEQACERGGHPMTAGS